MFRPFFAAVIFILSAGLYLSCTNSAANAPAQTDPSQFGEEVSVATVHAMREKEGVVVLDVRTPEEYNDAHIPGVIHIPMDLVLKRTDEFIGNKVIFVTCRSGNRSSRVTEALRAQGYNHVHNMTGGINAWIAAGYPVE